MSRAACLAVLVAIVTLPPRAPAQASELVPGQRVRLVAPGALAGRFEGTILARAGDTLTVARQGGTPQAVALGAIVSAQVSRGRTRRHGAWKGALWGGGVMGLLGVALAAAADTNTSGAEAAEFVTHVTTSGAIWGAIIGAFVRAERWEPLAQPAHLTVRPAPRGVALAVTLAR